MEGKPKYYKKSKQKEDPATRLSKSLSWILRHGAEQEGLTIDKEGWVSVKDLLTHPKFKHLTFDSLREAVDSNDKKRYEIQQIYQYDPTYYIRCVWGHSMKEVDDDKVLNLVTDAHLQQYEMVVHGTTLEEWQNVQKYGIHQNFQKYICFAHGASQGEVMSNLKDYCNAFIQIDIQKCLSDGIKFQQSQNGVILTSGLNGILPKEYIIFAWDKQENILFKSQKYNNENNFQMNQQNDNFQQQNQSGLMQSKQQN